MNSTEQQFFNDLEKKLWTAADKLRSNLDAAVYKCLDSCDYVPIRSWPLFKARHVLSTLLRSNESRPRP